MGEPKSTMEQRVAHISRERRRIAEEIDKHIMNGTSLSERAEAVRLEGERVRAELAEYPAKSQRLKEQHRQIEAEYKTMLQSMDKMLELTQAERSSPGALTKSGQFESEEDRLRTLDRIEEKIREYWDILRQQPSE